MNPVADISLTLLFEFLDSFSYVKSGTFPHRYKIFFKDKNNQPLFDWLESINFFPFYPSKHRRNTASYHQIVAYCFSGGWQAYLNGFVCDADNFSPTELHHIDSNTFNNHPRNLQFIPKTVHSILTKAQRSFNKTFKLFSSINVNYLVCFNRKGNLIVKVEDWFKSIILKTLICTSGFYRVQLNLKAIIQKVACYLNRYFRSKPSTVFNHPLVQQAITSYSSLSLTSL